MRFRLINDQRSTFPSHLKVVGLVLAGLFVAIVIILVVLWKRRVKQVQKRLKWVEVELREEEIHFSLVNPHFSTLTRGDDEQV